MQIKEFQESWSEFEILGTERRRDLWSEIDGAAGAGWDEGADRPRLMRGIILQRNADSQSKSNPR
jgi:hypothetical protein